MQYKSNNLTESSKTYRLNQEPTSAVSVPRSSIETNQIEQQIRREKALRAHLIDDSDEDEEAEKNDFLNPDNI